MAQLSKMGFLGALKKNIAYFILVAIILVTIATFILLTENKPFEGKANSSLKCDTWVANPYVVFENVIYDSKDNIIMPFLRNNGEKDIRIVSIGVNYEFKGPVTSHKADITLKPHSSKFIEIPTSKEPNRIVILTDKPCEEIAMGRSQEGWNAVSQEK